MYSTYTVYMYSTYTHTLHTCIFIHKSVSTLIQGTNYKSETPVGCEIFHVGMF